MTSPAAPPTDPLSEIVYALAAAGSADDLRLRAIYLSIARSRFADLAAEVSRIGAHLAAVEAELARVSAA